MMDAIGVHIKTTRHSVYEEYVRLAESDVIIELFGGKYKVTHFGYNAHPLCVPPIIYEIELQEVFET